MAIAGSAQSAPGAAVRSRRRASDATALRVGARLASVVITLPVVALAVYALLPSDGVWAHLVDTTLGGYLRNSAVLAVGVVLLAVVIGTSCAWLCTVCDFPGRRFFEWALILPLALPAYIIAYAYTGMLDYGGWLHEALRANLGLRPPPIRSLGGGVLVLALALYPYVYLLTRTMLLQQSVSLVEAARTLGLNPRQTFTRLILPVARPGIVAGAALVAMETLSDYAAVQHFGIQTFSTGIIRTWFGFGSLAGAAQLALLLLAFIAVLVLIERYQRRRCGYSETGSHKPLGVVYPLRGARAWGAVAVCALPILLGFAAPAGQLAAWALTGAASFDSAYRELVGNTLLLGAGAALATTFIAVVLGYARRLYPRDRWRWLYRAATFGYAAPGVVVAVGVMIVCASLEKIAGAGAAAAGLGSPGLFLSGTLFILYFAYTTRFLTFGFNTVENSLLKVSRNVDYAAATLKASGLALLREIHLPLIRSGLLTAMLLVFVEVIKELPATLVLRPFDFNTLAVRAAEMAADERLPDVALPALTIAAAGLLPLMILARQIARSGRRERGETT